MKKTLSFIIISLITFCAYAQNLYIGSFYVTTPTEESLYGDGGDKWANRRTVICDMFNFEQPDVLGLQSATDAQISFISQRMTTYSTAGDILYNKNMLEADSCGVVGEMPEGNTCSWAKLKKGETAFYVFNVCFTTDVNIASTSATRVIEAIGEINAENLPCFIIGYLGGNEKKSAYSKFALKYSDSFKKAPIISAEFGTVNNFDLAKTHATDRFDVVFASRKVSIKAYGLLQYGYYTKESDGNYKRRLPSTHFPVMVKVALP